MSSLQQRLAVSALILVSEALTENMHLTADERRQLREIIDMVKSAFEPRIPTLILADPDFEADELEIGASA